MFATSTRHTGNLGGLAGAHAICQQLAAGAGLTGTYRAWLSDALSGPASTMVHSSVPYVLVGGERIADNWADLTDGSIEHAIDRDEHGRQLDPEPFVCEGGEVWTNTTAAGSPSGLNDCLGWRGDRCDLQQRQHATEERALERRHLRQHELPHRSAALLLRAMI